MWGQSKKIKELQEKLTELENLFELLRARTEAVVQSTASMRGMINRKLYSGKLEKEEPSWLESNLEFVGIKQKDKKSDVVGM